MGAQMMSSNSSQKEWIGYDDPNMHYIRFPYPWDLKESNSLEFLEESNLIPGANGKVTAVSPDGTTTVDRKGKPIGVGAFASQRILVSAS